MSDLLRYGVFLRPDPATGLAVTTITGALRAQYGLVSAGAFPPHATLAGSLPLAGPESELTATVDALLATRSSFPVHNGGVARLDAAVVYDVHRLDGRPNQALVDLATAVDTAVRPLLDPAPTGIPADLYDRERWRGHLSLASHEMHVRADLRDEVEAYVVGLQVAVPAGFTADTVQLYRFTHPTWTGPWWSQLRWEHVQSWRLSSGSSG